ncbi:MAG: hypothetical protein KDH09_01665 [Chrysiogenetes bacterium]|nr:hypothetical protein [Chrysiogenetes bacterium]
MYSRDPYGGGGRVRFGGGGLSGGRPPRDLTIILATLFVTFALQFFSSTEIVPALLRLTPALWRGAFLWQAATYAFVGTGRPDLWFIFSLLMVFWFGRDVYNSLGQKRFRKLLAWAVIGSGLAAALVQLVTGWEARAFPFTLMQGQHMLLTIFIAAFAIRNAEATIQLFFVLPIQAKWFIAIEMAFAFLGFLSTKDLAGLLGLWSAVGITYVYLTPGGAKQIWKRWRLKMKKRKVQRELEQLKKEKGFRVVSRDDDDEPGPGGSGPWVN